MRHRSTSKWRACKCRQPSCFLNDPPFILAPHAPSCALCSPSISPHLHLSLPTDHRLCHDRAPCYIALPAVPHLEPEINGLHPRVPQLLLQAPAGTAAAAQAAPPAAWLAPPLSAAQGPASLSIQCAQVECVKQNLIAIWMPRVLGHAHAWQRVGQDGMGVRASRSQGGPWRVNRGAASLRHRN